jgi:hypothetical protein
MSVKLRPLEQRVAYLIGIQPYVKVSPPAYVTEVTVYHNMMNISRGHHVFVILMCQACSALTTENGAFCCGECAAWSARGKVPFAAEEWAALTHDLCLGLAHTYLKVLAE